jgi:Carboxypeptidase regulatory-like domain
MQLRTLPRGRATGGLATMVAAVTLALAACSSGSDAPAGPDLPGNPPPNPQFRQAAFIFDVNTVTKQVRITAPKRSVDGPAVSLETAAGLSASAVPVPNFSILGSDVINVTTDPTSYVASDVGTGGAPAGKVLVKFGVSISNILSGVQLVKPTFPTPPSTTLDRVYMFPFETPVKTTTGGTTDSSNVVIVELPSHGEVTPSSDFDGDGQTLTGAPWNFFNDTGCADGENTTGNTTADCFRYEAYPAPLGPSSSSAYQVIGFVIDPTVAQFRARMIVAADLASAGPVSPSTLSGTVTSTSLGPLAGLTITVSGGAGTATTDASGHYSIAGLNPGPKTVSITAGLPAGCVNPGSQSFNPDGSGGPITKDFTVTGCNAAVGTVSGQINFAGGSLTPSLAAAVVTITPSAAGTSATTTNPSAAGAYTSSAVQVGTGTGQGAGAVAVSNLPAGCSVQTPSTGYTGLTTSTPATAGAITINCVAPPAQYAYTTAWQLSGTTATLTVSFDLTPRNDPGVNGASADDLGAFQANIAYPTARLTLNSCTPSGTWDIGLINTSTAGQINPGLVSTTGKTGNVSMFTCTFTVGAGAATTVGTTTTGIVAGPDGTGDTVFQFANTDILVTDGTLNLP